MGILNGVLKGYIVWGIEKGFCMGILNGDFKW